jgi:hypothetical protein
LGRWLRRDPAGYVDPQSLVRYCRSSPIRGADPFGLDEFSFEQLWADIKKTAERVTPNPAERAVGREIGGAKEVKIQLAAALAKFKFGSGGGLKDNFMRHCYWTCLSAVLTKSASDTWKYVEAHESGDPTNKQSRERQRDSNRDRAANHNGLNCYAKITKASGNYTECGEDYNRYGADEGDCERCCGCTWDAIMASRVEDGMIRRLVYSRADVTDWNVHSISDVSAARAHDMGQQE